MEVWRLGPWIILGNETSVYIIYSLSPGSSSFVKESGIENYFPSGIGRWKDIMINWNHLTDFYKHYEGISKVFTNCSWMKIIDTSEYFWKNSGTNRFLLENLAILLLKPVDYENFPFTQLRISSKRWFCQELKMSGPVKGLAGRLQCKDREPARNL